MKTLIAGTSYIKDQHALWLAQTWVALGKSLNPDSDLLLVDTPAPFDPVVELDCDSRLAIRQFPDNIGHLTSTGRDGWGRATMEALSYAIQHDYDYVALLDADLIFCQSSEAIFRMMEDEHRVACSVRCPEYGWLEGIFFFNVRWLRATNFIRRYDWPNMQFGQLPELIMESLIGADLYLLPLLGSRDDGQRVTPESARDLVWLTHNHDPETYRALIRARVGNLESIA